jgi:hypothetical protein
MRNGEFRIATPSEVDFAGQDLIVVQAEDNRPGLYLMGQAYLSASLMMKFSPRTILSVALCRETNAVLGRDA